MQNLCTPSPTICTYTLTRLSGKFQSTELLPKVMVHSSMPEEVSVSPKNSIRLSWGLEKTDSPGLAILV